MDNEIGIKGEKVGRNRRLIAYHRAHPKMKVAAVARMFHISRQMAWKIINRSKRKENEDGQI